MPEPQYKMFIRYVKSDGTEIVATHPAISHEDAMEALELAVKVHTIEIHFKPIQEEN